LKHWDKNTLAGHASGQIQAAKKFISRLCKGNIKSLITLERERRGGGQEKLN
jgi:hypothetical protein